MHDILYILYILYKIYKRAHNVMDISNPNSASILLNLLRGDA